MDDFQLLLEGMRRNVEKHKNQLLIKIVLAWPYIPNFRRASIAKLDQSPARRGATTTPSNRDLNWRKIQLGTIEWTGEPAMLNSTRGVVMEGREMLEYFPRN